MPSKKTTSRRGRPKKTTRRTATAAPAARTRLQVDVTNEQADAVDRMVQQTGAASRAEVVRRAIGVYEQLQNASRGGGKIIVRNGRSEQVLLLS